MARPRLIVIGLDGATFRVIDPLLAAGKLPNLASIIRTGNRASLLSTIPPHTAAGWPTFLTGQHPGSHGILNFDEMTIGGYGAGARLVTSAAIAGRTFLDVAGEYGLRVAAVRVPMTYPAWPINGVLVSGYPSPESGNYTYPRELSRQIPGMRDPSDTPTPGQRAQLLLEEVRRTTRIGCEVLASGDVDLFTLVYQQSDIAHHWFWRYTDPDSPAYEEAEAAQYGDVIERVYREIDDGIGELLSFAGPNTHLLVLSDHGGCLAPTQLFHLNAWLASVGHLARRRHRLRSDLYEARRWLLPARVRARVKRVLGGALPIAAATAAETYYFNLEDVDWRRTHAFRFAVTAEIEGIMLNVAGRQPWGNVAPGRAYEDLRDQLLSMLKELRAPLDGQPLIRSAYRREEVFSGKYSERAPDILLRLHPSYRGGRNLSGEIFSSVPLDDLRRNLGGWHEPEGIFVAAGPLIRRGEGGQPRLLDMAPLVMRLLDLEPAPWMEGHVPFDLLEAEGYRDPVGASVEARGAPRVDTEEKGWETDAAEGAALTLEEEQSIKSRLHSLGYL